MHEATRVWVKVGLMSFGGSAGQIAVMHRELVETRRWISDARFLHALNYCMLLPGPEATQLAIYIGWMLHRTLGGLIAPKPMPLPKYSRPASIAGERSRNSVLASGMLAPNSNAAPNAAAIDGEGMRRRMSTGYSEIERTSHCYVRFPVPAANFTNVSLGSSAAGRSGSALLWLF